MNDEYKSLVGEATRLSVPHQLTDEATAGFVGAALLASNGKVYTGVSLTGACGIQFCGEVGAVMSMLKDNVSQIKAIAAVSNDHKLMPPCGRCRELMFELDRRNLQTDVILENGKVIKLADIFPERWQELWEDSIKPVV
ncbi:MAG: hypothetical protein A3J39_02680 [Sulfuricurvum sp. RIFCSPHIGHO2_12_FULL_44_8]|nr:MAG: hypothetical protein A3J39_02680 [Sulfuricurvum sp. RIFCSPHIGHO2_12_FULL_44_8]